MDHINWKWVRRALYISVAALILLPIVTFGMAYMIVEVPKPGDIRTNQVSTILASDGSEIAKIVPPEGNRVDVNIDQIPVHVRDAVMAAEDRDFYSNPGFSFSGFARAAKNNIFGGDVQGGSTITQQYVKNALVGSQRSGLGGIVRKAKELVISTKMSSEWSKDQVLQSYLNIIYFGRGAYGIGAASKAYFDKPVEQLTVADGALLAALIQQPSGLDPATNPDGALERWNWVLDGMVEIGALSQTDRAAQVFPPTVPPDLARVQNQTTGPNGLIERQVQKELLDLFDISEQTLNTEGLQVTTTIDPKAQSAAESAVTETMEGQNPDMRSAVVSIDPKTGGVKAYYGGSDAQGFDFAQAGLPTGSSFKVFALVAALEQGIGLGYQVDSSPVEVNGIKITNVEGGGCGTCNIAEALKRSLNTAYYRLMLKLKNGPSDVAAAAHQAGIADSFPGVEHTLSEDGKGGPPNNGIVLGQYQSRVHRHGFGVRHDRGLRRLPPPAFRAEGGERRGPGAVRRGQRGQLRRTANRQGRRRQRHRRDAADRRLLQRSRPGRRTAVGGEDRHQSARRHGCQPGRLDGRLHTVAVDGGMGRHDRRHPTAGEQVGVAGVRVRPAVRHLEGHDGRCAGGHRQRVVPEADRDRWLRRCARGPAAATEHTSTLGHRDSAVD